MALPDRDALAGFTNINERPPGRLVSIAGLVLPGISRVQADVVPFAEQWQRANRAAMARTGPLWVALGDSLSQGIGAPAFDRGWVGQLHRRLSVEGRDLRLVNLSMSGARTQDVLDRQLPALAALVRGEPVPDLVTLMIGSNDIVSRRYRDGVGRRMDRILRQLPAGTVVTTMPNPTAAANEVNAVIERAAAERGIVVADLRDPLTTSWRGKLSADHFHPNELGYEALTAVVHRAISGRGRT